MELILSSEPKLRKHPKYTTPKKRLNNIINNKKNRNPINFLKEIGYKIKLQAKYNFFFFLFINDFFMCKISH